MIGKQDHSDQQNSSFYVHRNAIYLSVILVLGTALRLYDLGAESFWFDEIITVHRVSQDLQTLGHRFATQGNVTRNALYYLIAYFWAQPLEMTEASIRSLSVLFGILSLGMMYLVGRQLFNEKVGLLSSLFMAVSEFQIQHSQEARFYSLLVLLTLASIYCYILALRTGHVRSWVISGLVNVLLFYTHTYGVFIFAVEYIHYLFYWKNSRSTFVQWGISQALVVVAIVVGLIPLLEDGSVIGLGGGLAWITVPSFKDLFLTIYRYLFPQNHRHSWLFIGVSFAAAILFFALAAFLHNFRKKENHWLADLKDWFRNAQYPSPMSSAMLLVAVWFVFPVITPFVYSNLFSPIFVDRYTICAAPAFYLLLASGVARISRLVPTYISLGAMMLVIVPGLQDYYVADINEQWQEVAAYVQENGRSADVIVFTPDDNGYQARSFDWYYRGSLPSCGMSSNVKDDHAVAEILSKCISGHDRIWVIMRGPSAVIGRFTSYFLSPDRTGVHLVDEQRFVKVSIYLLELSK